MYQPLELGEATPERIKQFIADHVDPQLADVHCMLRLPMAKRSLRAGCELAATSALLDLVAGSSVMLHEPLRFRTRGDRSKLFRAVLERAYPWGPEDAGVVPRNKAVQVLYFWYRNPFAHAIGVIEDGEGPDIQVAIEKAPMSERDVVALAMSDQPPDWLPPTLRKSGDGVVVSVPALYRGVRRMVLGLAGNATKMMMLASVLDDSPAKNRTAEQGDTRADGMSVSPSPAPDRAGAGEDSGPA